MRTGDQTAITGKGTGGGPAKRPYFRNSVAMSNTIDYAAETTAHETDVHPNDGKEDLISIVSNVPKGYRDISTHGSTNPKYTRV